MVSHRRLCEGREAGIISDGRWASFEATRNDINRAVELLHSVSLSPQVRRFDDLGMYIGYDDDLRRHGQYMALI